MVQTLGYGLGLLLVVLMSDVLVLCFPLNAGGASKMQRQRQKLFSSTLTPSSSSSTKKTEFFDRVEAGLLDRYKGDTIDRVIQFCRYARGDMPPPGAQSAFQEPCELFIDDLTAKAWWETSDFPWVKELEKHVDVISQELRSAVQADENWGKSRRHNSMGDGWSSFRLQKLGEWNDENMSVFPQTMGILRDAEVPLAIRGCMFAKQTPGTGVVPHSDEWNFVLTLHLGIVIPKGQGCWIRVGEETRSWQQDKALIFDTSFTHSTGNDSEEDRFVLIFDIWHPELSLDERSALTYIFDERTKVDNAH